jgi:hypothetical protein
MRQVEPVNDNVTDVAATQPSEAITRLSNKEADPAAAEREAEGSKTSASRGNTTDSRWPRWPNAWPDGSRRS